MVGSTLPRAIASELSLDDESVEPSWSTVTVKVHDAVLPASSEATSTTCRGDRRTQNNHVQITGERGEYKHEC